MQAPYRTAEPVPQPTAEELAEKLRRAEEEISNLRSKVETLQTTNNSLSGLVERVSKSRVDFSVVQPNYATTAEWHRMRERLATLEKERIAAPKTYADDPFIFVPDVRANAILQQAAASGIEQRLLHLQEEAAELIVAACHWRRGRKGSEAEFAGELVDVQLMIESLRHVRPSSTFHKAVLAARAQKIDKLEAILIEADRRR